MSWNDADIIRQMEDLNKQQSSAGDGVYQTMLRQLERLASSPDITKATASKIMLAIAPILEELKQLRMTKKVEDVDRIVSIIAGTADGLSLATASLLLMLDPLTSAIAADRMFNSMKKVLALAGGLDGAEKPHGPTDRV